MKANLILWTIILSVLGCLVFGPSLFGLMVGTVFYMAFLGLQMIPAMYWVLLLAIVILAAIYRGARP